MASAGTPHVYVMTTATQVPALLKPPSSACPPRTRDHAGVRVAPLALVSAGFLLNSALYRSYAAALASHGWGVALWDLSELCDDTITVAYMRQVGARASAHKCKMHGRVCRRHAVLAVWNRWALQVIGAC